MAVKKTEKVLIPLPLYETMWTLLHLTSEFSDMLKKNDIGEIYLNTINKTLKECNNTATKFIEECHDKRKKAKTIRLKRASLSSLHS